MVPATLGVVVLFLVAVYGPMIAPHDLSFFVALRDGRPPPFDPSADLPLGTDDLGRDLWSWVLIGARVTLGMAVAAAVLRVAIGSALGALAGWRAGVLDTVLSRIALGFSSIPATVLAVLGVIAFDLYAGPPAVALALGLVGWAESFQFARRQTRLEGGQLYVEAARSLGMREHRVILGHLFPNIAPTLIVLFTLQVSAVLLLLAELGLLQIFIGGPLTELTPTGRSVLVPSTPDWSSMLASTRPIRVVGGGSVWPLLAPALALVFSVGAVNLFGDALARRAQRLDVYRLVTRRQLLALGLVAVVLLAPAALWPSALARELAYADHIAVPDSLGGARERLGGDEVSFTKDVPVAEVSLSGPGGDLHGPPDLDVYSADDATVRGPLVAVGRTALFRPDPAVVGAILVLPGASLANADATATAARRFGATAVIFVTSSSLPFPVGPGLYATPVVRVSAEALQRATGTGLPNGFDGGSIKPTTLASRATLSVTARSTHVSGSVRVVRIGPDAADAPIVLVAARSGAASVAALAAVADHVRAHPLAAAIVAVAGADPDGGGAALNAAITSLTLGERAHIQAVVLIEGAGRVTIAPDPPDRSQPAATTASGRISRRVADALGLRLEPQSTRSLQLAARAAGVAAPTVILRGDAGESVSAEAVREMARAALTLVAYVARPAPELR